MLYRNEKTGAIIDVKSELGGKWKPVEAEKTAEKPKATTKAKKKGK